MAGMMGVEPMALCLTGTCSTSELHPSDAVLSGARPAYEKAALADGRFIELLMCMPSVAHEGAISAENGDG